MDTDDILKATQSTKRLIEDDNYYKYIFKKTERIVSVVFYISKSLSDSPRVVRHIEDIEHAARVLHDVVLASLQTRTHVAEDAVRETAYALVTLESKLRVAQVSGLIAPEIMQVLGNETDAVLRGLNKYLDGDIISALQGNVSAARPAQAVPQRAATPAHKSATPTQGNGPVGSANPLTRQGRIKAVIEAQGEVSIKDLSAIVTDVSEKTIQRELNSMISDNILRRIGEKRWSRYTLF